MFQLCFKCIYVCLCDYHCQVDVRLFVNCLNTTVDCLYFTPSSCCVIIIMYITSIEIKTEIESEIE